MKFVVDSFSKVALKQLEAVERVYEGSLTDVKIFVRENRDVRIMTGKF